MIGEMIATAAAGGPMRFWLQAPNFPNQLTPDQQYEITRLALLNHRGTGLDGFLVPLGVFAMVVLIVWIGNRSKQTRIRAQAELRKQLLDKFGSTQELATFMESKGGQQFLGDLHWQYMSEHYMIRPRFPTGGVVVTLVGLALLGLSVTQRHFIVPGVILLAVGAGLLISAIAAHKLAADRNRDMHSGPGMQPLPPA